MTKPTFTIEMNGKKHVLHLGLGFLDKMDQLPRYEMERNGFRVGASLQTIFMHLSMNNANVIKDIIKYGTMTNADRPTDSEIEAWIIQQLETEETASKMFDDFLALYEKLPGAKLLLERGKKQVLQN